MIRKTLKPPVVTTRMLYRLLRTHYEVAGVLYHLKREIRIIIYPRDNERDGQYSVSIAPLFTSNALVFHTHFGPSHPSAVDIQTSEKIGQARFAIFGSDGCTILANGRVVRKMGNNHIWGIYTRVVVEER